jgi:hypothetical protein
LYPSAVARRYFVKIVRFGCLQLQRCYRHGRVSGPHPTGANRPAGTGGSGLTDVFKEFKLSQPEPASGCLGTQCGAEIPRMVAFHDSHACIPGNNLVGFVSFSLA